MGFKRPFTADENPGLTFKQTKAPCIDILSKYVESYQLSFTEKLDAVDKEESYNRSSENSLKHERHGANSLPLINDFAKEFILSSSMQHEDPGSSSSLDPVLSEYDGHEASKCVVAPPQDEDSCYFLKLPRKLVPIGADHQAVIPSCKSSYHGKIDSVSSCVIMKPGSDSIDEIDDGGGRKGCNCPDANTTRCVRQHIMEARENLRVSIGHERFVDLGFYEMGEEVACHWSEEEEQVFHRVVYSNPASLGFNFWNHLYEAFPFRSKKEVVSYYFNVFMLRRRASQNRSSMMDIDSDDDEFHALSRISDKLPLDENSVLEGDDGESSDDSDGGNANDDHAGSEDSGVDSLSEPYEVSPRDADNKDRKMRSSCSEYSIQEDSCMSFEFPADADKHGSKFCLFDACDSKLWPEQCGGGGGGGGAKEVDFLPTCNIIEEIFGEGD